MLYMYIYICCVHTQVLVEVTSSAMMVYLLEVLLVRLGLYLIGAPAVMLDLVAYIGYKFVPLCINMGGACDC
jgi:protein transport protein YIF1